MEVLHRSVDGRAVNVARQEIECMHSAIQHFKTDGKKILGDPTLVYEFLLEYGQDFSGTPWTKFRGSGYRKMRQQMCFANCWFASLIRDELTYCEGFAYAGLISAHHAWCLDDQGRVVDFTWRKSVQNRLPEVEWQYFGVRIEQSPQLCKWWLEKGTASVLFDLDYSEDVTQFLVAA